VLLVFLKWVASFSHVDEETGSKMDLGNLATVITPSILKANKRDGARDESLLGIGVVTQLLEEQDELYLVPEEFVPLLHDQNYFTSTMDQPRELLKKIDLFLRMRYGTSGPANKGPSPSPQGNPYMSSTPPNRNDLPGSGSFTGNYPDRPVTAPHVGDQRSLPPHPGLPHQPFSSPHPGSHIQGSGPPRPSLDNFWAPPSIPGNDPRRDSPGSRPNSFLRPSNEPSPASFGGMSPSRNSPLGA
jgi:hypothetical protein